MNTMKKALDFKGWIYPVMFLIYIAWTVPGAFPLVNYESDANVLLSGVSYLLTEGTVSPVWGYHYAEQPLAYWLIAGFSKITGSGVEASYCMLCWLSMILLAWLTVEVIHRLTGLSRSIILLSWWLMPESYACGMYGNTAVLAMPAAMAGFWFILQRKYIIATAFLCLASLFRVDVVCIYPVVLPLMLFIGLKWQKSLGISALMALAVAVTGIFGVRLLGGDQMETLTSYGYWNTVIEAVSRVKAIVGCYSIPGMIFILGGIAIMTRDKKYMLLAVMLVPLFTEHIVYMKMGCAAKHFLYALPFAAGIAGYLSNSLAKGIRRKRPAAIAALVVLGLYETCYAVVSGDRFKLESERYEEWLPENKKRAPRLEICSFNTSRFTVRMGIGGGMWFGTADEIMVTSGNLFYPMAIHNLKTEARSRYKSVLEFLDGQQNYVAVTCFYVDHPVLQTHLFEKGWQVAEQPTEHYQSSKNQSWQNRWTVDLRDKNGDRVGIVCWDMNFKIKPFGEEVTLQDNPFLTVVREIPHDGRPVYVIAPGYESYLITGYMQNLEEEGLVQRKAPMVWQVKPGLQRSKDAKD